MCISPNPKLICGEAFDAGFKLVAKNPVLFFLGICAGDRRSGGAEPIMIEYVHTAAALRPDTFSSRLKIYQPVELVISHPWLANPRALQTSARDGKAYQMHMRARKIVKGMQKKHALMQECQGI
jgi:hypothetical protein